MRSANQLNDWPGAAMFIGLKEDGRLAVCYSAGHDSWGRFRDNWNGASQLIEVTSCQQAGDGKIAVWGIDEKRQLWGCGEETPGTGNFGPWVGPNWMSAPRHGAVIVGQNEDYSVVTNFQAGPGANAWTGWSTPNWANAPLSYELTACAQNNGLGQIWAITLKGTLTSIAQREPGRWPDRWSDYDN
jgi:hypothetical protein